MPLILSQAMHFDPATIGLLMSARRGAIAAGAPLLTLLADAARRHRLVVASALTAYYSCTLVLTRVRSLPSVTLVLLVRDALLAGVEPVVNAAVLASLTLTPAARSASHPDCPDAAHPSASSLAKTETDAEREEEEGSGGNAGGFGGVRAWGSFGWGVLSFAVPALCAVAFGPRANSYMPMLVAQALVGIAVVLLTTFGLDLSPRLFSHADSVTDALTSPNVAPPSQLPDHSDPVIPNPTTTPRPTSWSQRLRALWSEADRDDAISCFLASLLQGAVLGAVQTTLFLYLSSQNVPTSLLGLSVAASCLGETILFSREHSIRRSRSDRLALRSAIAGNALTLCLYACISPCPSGFPTVAALLFAEFVNGASYALFLAAAVALAARSAPKHRRAAAQGVVQCIAFGVGPAIGALLGGKLYQSIGAIPLYLFLAFFDVLLVLRIPS